MFDSDKPRPIYLYQHEFWGFLNMITTATALPYSITSSIDSSSDLAIQTAEAYMSI